MSFSFNLSCILRSNNNNFTKLLLSIANKNKFISLLKDNQSGNLKMFGNFIFKANEKCANLLN